MLKPTGLAILAALLLSLPASAAADVVRSLPTVERTLTAKKAVERDCFQRVVTGRPGAASTVYRARMSGFVTVRLKGPRTSDWDLALFNKRTGRRVAGSGGFRSREVAQAWIGSGDRLLVQGCRRSGRARKVSASIHFLDIAPPKSSGAPALVRVDYRSENDLRRLERLGADVTHHIHDGKADVIVSSPKHIELLRDKGFDLDVEIADLGRHFRRSRAADARFTQRVNKSSLPTGRTTYRVYEDYQRELKEIVDANGSIARPIVLPKRTFQGREIQGVEFAENVGADDGRPVFLLVAMHHAREWPSAESAMEFAHMVADGYGSDPRITELLRTTRLVVVPLINADGFISSRTLSRVDPVDNVTNQGDGNGTGQGVNPNLDDLDEDGGADPYDCIDVSVGCDTRASFYESISAPGGLLAYRRKNCDGLVPDGRVPCELQYGVDPNRNYGYNWGGPGSDAEVHSQSYRGTGPWSEPETQAVHEFSQRRQITNILTIHNVAALILRPPGTSGGGLAPDEDALRAIGDAMADATGYTSQYGYQLYDTSGTTEDWNYAQQGAFGYTIEMGPEDGEFHMPYETGVVREWDGSAAGNGKGLREAYMIAWEAAANPAHHSVLAGTAPAGRVLRLKKSFETTTYPVCKRQLVTIAPFNSEGLVYDNFQNATGQPFPCAEEQPAMNVPDGLETTLVVPPSGRFEWHVTPSTRPFVGKDQQDMSAVLEQRTFDGSGDVAQQPPTAGASTVSDVEVPFTVDTSDGAQKLGVELAWTPGIQDYDLYLYKVEGGTRELIGKGLSTAPGTSATTSEPEVISVNGLQPGEYVAVVTNYAGVTNNWQLKVTEYGPGEIVPGHKEAWTLTCESPAGVHEKREVIVDRGERLKLNLMSCGRKAKG